MALSASSTLLQQGSQDMAMATNASLLGTEVDVSASAFLDSYQQELESRRVLQEQRELSRMDIYVLRDRDRRRAEETRRRVLQEQQDREDRDRREEARRERVRDHIDGME